MDTFSGFLSIIGSIELPQIGVADIVQIAILAVVLYYVLVLVRNTRTWFLIRGIIVILVFYAVAVVFELNTILFIVRHGLSVLVMAMVIVFQPELRKALEQLGQRNMIFNVLAGPGSRDDAFDQRTVEELVRASFALGRTRTGALIVIEQTVPLLEYIETGIEVDAKLTSQLLINIFEHNTPLHDGAVIVRGDRVVSATCYLPLSGNQEIPKELGTRHRAAMGVSETTDSVTIIVSEETGKVSVAERGEIRRDLTRDELRERLDALRTSEDVQGNTLKFWKGWQKNESKDSE